MTAHPYTALITLLTVALLFAVAVNVGRARGKYGIKAPAVTGHEMFDRAFRVQMNTIEWSVTTLPALWLCAGFYSDTRAAVLGAVWLAARIWYALAYLRDPGSRSQAFLIAFIAFSGLWLGAAWAIIRVLAGGVPEH